MEPHVIITISRQYGTYGREIGRQLAEYLDIGYYNKEIMKHIAQDMHINPEFFSNENVNDAGFFSVSNRHGSLINMTELSINSQVFEKSCELIRGIAEKESAVIIGRCADYILRDNPHCIKVYFYNDVEERIQLAIKEYELAPKQARKFVMRQDERRSGFYEFYTNQIWGEPKNYDLMINTSQMSKDEVIDLLAAVYDRKKGVTTLKGAFKDQYIEQRSMKE
ncbi:MAG: AAA family ATPase [Catenisphaera adipataccumulans]|jgi:cytidylate kinase|uniref:AAA family ATPase n=1 Tax=Catenisphaera adipataccumulans TaxID=700500 RepID=UPI003D8BEC66